MIKNACRLIHFALLTYHLPTSGTISSYWGEFNPASWVMNEKEKKNPNPGGWRGTQGAGSLPFGGSARSLGKGREALIWRCPKGK